MSRTRIRTANAAPGNLYAVDGEDGPFHVCSWFVEVETEDRRTFRHEFVFPGHWECPDEGFFYPNHAAEECAEVAAGRVLEVGSVDLRHWEEFHRPSLEELWAYDAEQEELARRGHYVDPMYM
jgi:hypothetical protein